MDLRNTTRNEMENVLASRQREIDQKWAKLQDAERQLKRRQEKLHADTQTLQDEKAALRHQHQKLTEQLKRTASDAKLVASVVLRTITGVILGTTTLDKEGGFTALKEDQKVIDRFELRPLLTRVVNTVVTFWNVAKTQLSEQRQQAVQDAAKAAQQSNDTGPKAGP